jgi:hypothetical protein
MLPSHGWVGCRKCFSTNDSAQLLGQGFPKPWKIESPNGSWGSSDPLVMVIGFSRGANQSKPMPFDKVAFNGMRPQLTSILQALGLLGPDDQVDHRIKAEEKDFHFASLFRCSVAMWDNKKQSYAKSGNSILEKCLASQDTRQVAHNCTEQYFTALPARTRLVVLLGNSQDYIDGCRQLFQRIYPDIKPINCVAYGNGHVIWVHTVHAKALGKLIPEWLEGKPTTNGRKFAPAREAVQRSGVLPLLSK